MMVNAKTAHNEEAHKETSGLIYYELPQYVNPFFFFHLGLSQI